MSSMETTLIPAFEPTVVRVAGSLPLDISAG